MSSFTLPFPVGPIDSTVTRDWFNRVQVFLTSIASLTDDQTFTGQNTILGDYHGTGQLLVHQRIANPGTGDNNWAIVGWTDITAKLPGGTAVGGFFTARCWDGGSGAWGIVTEVWSGSPTRGTINLCSLVGAELGVVQQNPSNTTNTYGVLSVFKNRPDGALSPFLGKGANLYANNSAAYVVSSQPPSTAGELCGWSVGMFFDTSFCLSPPGVGGTAIGIDMSRLTSAIMQVAIWIPNDSVIRMGDNLAYIAYRSSSQDVVIGSSGVDWFGVNAGTGRIDMSTTTSSTATAGIVQAVPAVCAGYWALTINGVAFRIALFAP